MASIAFCCNCDPRRADKVVFVTMDNHPSLGRKEEEYAVISPFWYQLEVAGCFGSTKIDPSNGPPRTG